MRDKSAEFLEKLKKCESLPAHARKKFADLQQIETQQDAYIRRPSSVASNRTKFGEFFPSENSGYQKISQRSGTRTSSLQKNYRIQNKPAVDSELETAHNNPSQERIKNENLSFPTDYHEFAHGRASTTPNTPFDTLIRDITVNLLTKPNLNQQRCLTTTPSELTESNDTKPYLSQHAPFKQQRRRPPLIVQVPVIQRPQTNVYDAIEDLEYNGIMGSVDTPAVRPQTGRRDASATTHIDLERKRDFVYAIYKHLLMRNSEIEKSILNYKTYSQSKNKITYDPLKLPKKGELYLEKLVAEDLMKNISHLFQMALNEPPSGSDEKRMSSTNGFSKSPTVGKLNRNERNIQTPSYSTKARTAIRTEAEEGHESQAVKGDQETQKNSQVSFYTFSTDAFFSNPLPKKILKDDGNRVQVTTKRYKPSLKTEATSSNLSTDYQLLGVICKTETHNLTVKKHKKMLSERLNNHRVLKKSSESSERENLSVNLPNGPEWDHLAQVERIHAAFNRKNAQFKKRPVSSIQNRFTTPSYYSNNHHILVRDLTPLPVDFQQKKVEVS